MIRALWTGFGAMVVAAVMLRLTVMVALGQRGAVGVVEVVVLVGAFVVGALWSVNQTGRR